MITYINYYFERQCNSTQSFSDFESSLGHCDVLRLPDILREYEFQNGVIKIVVYFSCLYLAK